MQVINDELNKEKEPIDSRLVFRIQLTQGGKGNRYKARLCARGFRQEFGIDYNETFCSVFRYDAVQIMLALAAYGDLELLQFNVSTAFLYGKVDEEIFMKLLEGLHVPEKRNFVCRLHKALYGLNQASRCW